MKIDPATLRWRKSSASQPANTNCVEVAELPCGGRAVRDSKLGDASEVLWFGSREWRAFVSAVKDGEFG